MQRAVSTKQDAQPAENMAALQPMNRTMPYEGSDALLSQRLVLKTRPYRPHGSSPAPARDSSQPPVSGAGSRRPRPETSHQKAVSMNRKMRIDRILFAKLTAEHRHVRSIRKKQGRTRVFRAMRRIRDLPDNYDSEDEDGWGPGGFFPNRKKLEDYGEEAAYAKKILDRAVRRLAREVNGGRVNGSKREHSKRKRRLEDSALDDDQALLAFGKRGRSDDDYDASNRRGIGRPEQRAEVLDDLDLDLLGESREGGPREGERMDVMDGESGGEDSGDDVTEEEAMDVDVP